MKKRINHIQSLEFFLVKNLLLRMINKKNSSEWIKLLMKMKLMTIE